MTLALSTPPNGSALVKAPTVQQQLSAAVSRYNLLIRYTKQVMVPGVDFGTIPGCEKKKLTTGQEVPNMQLFKPGAEKLVRLFNYGSRVEMTDKVEDWTGEAHGGEPLFSYSYKAVISDRSGLVLAECEGNCNSWESKYRYRASARKCPSCGNATIKKGSDKFGGGWYCDAKAGGCGKKYKDGDQTIESQSAGKVKNDDIFSQINTIKKMAQKRAFVGAVILAANASELFSVERDVIDGDWDDVGNDYGDYQQTAANEVDTEIMDLGTPEDRIKTMWRLTGLSREQLSQAIAETGLNQATSHADADRINERVLITYAMQRGYQESVAFDLIGQVKEELGAGTDEDVFTLFCHELGQLPRGNVSPGREKPDTFKGVSVG